MTHATRVGELVFDDGVEDNWKQVLFIGVDPKHHAKRQARVLERIGSLQTSLTSAMTTSIHRMGLGQWALFRAKTSYGILRVTRFIGIQGFESGECNQELAEFAEKKTSCLISDIQSAEGDELVRLTRAGVFLTDLMNIDGPGMLTCNADADVTERIISVVEASERLVYEGAMTPQQALVKTMKFRRRVVRAHRRSKVAS